MFNGFAVKHKLSPYPQNDMDLSSTQFNAHSFLKYLNRLYQLYCRCLSQEKCKYQLKPRAIDGSSYCENNNSVLIGGQSHDYIR